MQVNQILPESVIALRQLVYQARPLATATEIRDCASVLCMHLP
jgi:hypothetical protein